MGELKIRIYPDPTLRKPASRVSRVGDEEKNILADMAGAMYLNSGVGLAAVQVGIDKQLAVIDIGNGLIKMANPEIVKCEGSQCEEEGCLSVPGIGVKIKRANSVTVRFLSGDGETVQIQAQGLLARAIQHEIDHLCGIVILDHVNPIKRLFLKKRAVKGKALDKRPAI